MTELLSEAERAEIVGLAASDYASGGTTAAMEVGPDYFREVVENEDDQMVRLMFFMLTYFPRDFRTWEPINDYFFRMLEFENKAMGWLPAQHGKTTMLGRFQVWVSIREPEISMIYTEKNEPTACRRSRAVRMILEENHLLQKHFGTFKPPPKSSKPWADNAWTIAQRKGTIDTPTLAAFGAGGGSLLGNRCNILFVDDPVTHENSASERERASLLAWYNEAAATSPYPLPVAAERYLVKIFLIGTVFRRDDLFHEVLSKGQYHHLWLKAVPHEATGATLSPRFCYVPPDELEAKALYDPRYEDLRERVQSGLIRNLYEYQRNNGRRAFNRRYQNVALDEEAQWCREEWIRGGTGDDAPPGGYPGCLDPDRVIGQKGQDWVYVTGCDPAGGSGSKRSKNFGCVTIGCDPKRPTEVYLVDLDCGQYPLIADSPTRKTQAGIVLHHAREYGSRVVIEDNAQQRGWQDALAVEARRRGAVVSSSGHFTGKNKTDPEIGVQSLAPYFENGHFHFPYGDVSSKRKSELLIEELVYWGFHPTTDLAMALWFAMTKLHKMMRGLQKRVPTSMVQRTYVNRLPNLVFPAHWTSEQRQAWMQDQEEVL